MILLMDIAPYRQGRELIGASGASCSGQCLNAAVLDKGKNTLSSPARHEPHVIQSDNYLATEGGNRLRLVGIRQSHARRLRGGRNRRRSSLLKNPGYGFQGIRQTLQRFFIRAHVRLIKMAARTGLYAAPRLPDRITLFRFDLCFGFRPHLGRAIS